MAGSFADRFGRRRAFRLGLVVFGLGSLACSLAPGIGWLIAARALQAAGGTMLNPVAMAIIVTTFTDHAERMRAIGVFSGVSGLALAVGPIVGGALVDGFGWRSVFTVNLPIVAAALVGTALFVPESRAARPRRFDPVGQALVCLVLGGTAYGIIETGALSWTTPVVGGALLCLVRYESRRAEPLLDPRLFRNPPFSAAIGTAVLSLCGFGAFLFVSTLYLQEVRGLPPLRAGLCLLPVGVLIALLSPISGRLVAGRGPRPPLLISGAALTMAGAASLGLGPDTPLAVVLAAFLLFGVSQGIVNPPVNNAAVAGMPIAMAGVAASLATTGRQVGITLGVAISGALAGPDLIDVGWLAVALGLGVCALTALSPAAVHHSLSEKH
ncbi:MFS transporter [Actinoplanes sp. TBRC 11911]|uniref:MFS transporter n=1 Tax=Actinoplanes sp. TBRC 11911 TaxID=2729386 RepID=UPI001B7D6D27|nr:MFS transporter [Actinoplanes sp. TBRC 11911]